MSRHFGKGSILSDTDLSTTANSKWFRLENLDNYSITAVWTGTPSGVFKLQSSNDDGGVQDQPTITNITDVAGSNVTVVSGAGSPLQWDVDLAPYRWVRVSWANTGGTGTLTVLRANGKGAG